MTRVKTETVLSTLQRVVLLALVTIILLGLNYAVWAISIGQISIVLTAFVTLAWWVLWTERWVGAGGLGLSTARLQMVLLVVPDAVAWAAYKRQRRSLGVLAITLGLLFLSPMPWQPAWFPTWPDAMQRVFGYTLLPSVWLAAGMAALLLSWTSIIGGWRHTARVRSLIGHWTCC